MERIERYKSNKFWYRVTVLFSGLAILIAVNQLFRLRLFGFLPMDNSYLYYLLALYLSLAFVVYPASKSAPRNKVPWYDFILFLLTVIVAIYFGIHGMAIIQLGWDWNAPVLPTTFSVFLWFLALEAVRRSSGRVLMIICFIFSIYPLFAFYLPGVLQGQPYDFFTTARVHAMSTNSILGIPLYTVGTLLIGFMLFGVVLQCTGGGAFFFNLAQSLLGRTRGGPAKVAVVGSAFFGMLSGSAISNVLTIGSMTIPAMKRTGYPSHYAGAIEACSSTGGPITPPVMGAAAFVMASFLNMPYAKVALAAALPACLYFWGLLVQVDAHAAKVGLKGLSRTELPSFWKTLKDGWFYIFVLFVLVYFLFTLRVEGWAPFYASLVLIALAMIKRETRLSWSGFLEMIIKTGLVMVELVCILAAVSLIIGSLSATGVALSFSRELVVAVGNNAFLILCIGALTSFILGMGMTATACYIFLAIVMAPALVSLGIDPVAAHLFVLYWGDLSYITPPVALAAITAAGLAGADPMQTGWTATKFGAVKYIVPFFFVYNPALIFHGTWSEILFYAVVAFLGVYILGCALEGYLIGVGVLTQPVLRAVLLAGGVLIAFPNIITTVIGVILVLIVYLVSYLMHKKPLKQDISS